MKVPISFGTCVTRSLTKWKGGPNSIIGGSTLDNVFDAPQYLRNMARLLRPGGRISEVNHLNNHQRPYIILPPPWFYDYFVVNSFADCRVYGIEYPDQAHAWRLEAHVNPQQQLGWGLIDNFDGDDTCTLVTVVFAEKGERSTWMKSPVQDAWRNMEQVKVYNDALAKIVASGRPDWGLHVSESIPKSPNRTKHNYRYVRHF